MDAVLRDEGICMLILLLVSHLQTRICAEDLSVASTAKGKEKTVRCESMHFIRDPYLQI